MARGENGNFFTFFIYWNVDRLVWVLSSLTWGDLPRRRIRPRNQFGEIGKESFGAFDSYFMIM